MGRVNPELYTVSHSEMDVYKTCKRRWWLQYYLKLRRKSSSRSVARDTGINVHEALHTFYVAGGLDGLDAEELMFTFLQNAKDEDLLSVSEEERDKVAKIHKLSETLCRGYIQWLHETGADEGYSFDQSEITLTAPGPVEGTELLGIIDLGGTERRSGDLFVMDTKVTDTIDGMIKTVHIQEQGPLYAVLARLNDPNPKRGFRVVWNMIKRSQQTAKAKPPFYVRYELALNSDQLFVFYKQLQGQIEEMLRTEARLNDGELHNIVAYPTPTKDCSWKCPYFAVCGALSDPRTDANYLLNVYYTTPEQREQEKQLEMT